MAEVKHGRRPIHQPAQLAYLMRFCLFLLFLFVTGAAMAETPPAEGTLVDVGKLPLQGDCGANELDAKAHGGETSKFSTWTCTGSSVVPLTFTYTSGVKE